MLLSYFGMRYHTDITCCIPRYTHPISVPALYTTLSATNMAPTTQVPYRYQHHIRRVPNVISTWMLVWVLLCSRVVTCHAKPSVPRAEALATNFATTTHSASSRVDPTGTSKAYLSHDEIKPTVTVTIGAVNVASVSAIDTDRPDAGHHPTSDKARPADPLGHNMYGDDASSKVRTMFFEIVGACIGVATLFVAVLALNRMPKRKLSDPESPPLECNHRQPLQHPGPGRTQNQGEPVELDAEETAVEMQCEEVAIRNFNVQAPHQPSGTTAEAC
jgi:hypothetical protein